MDEGAREKRVEFSAIKKELADYRVQEKEEGFFLAALHEALRAAQRGNFGVGAVLVKDDNIVATGHNKVFNPIFSSDLHAEMDVLNKFEQSFRTNGPLQGFTLYTTVECCPMCLCRAITSGVNRVAYLCADEQGGMVHKMKDLPEAWLHLAARQQFDHVANYVKLQELATRIFGSTVRALDAKLGQSHVTAIRVKRRRL